ncbi:MAG: ABC transporter permease [Candidatus Muiribacteriaceae bacterium]
MIDIRNVSKIYKMGDLELKALDDVSLTIEEGEFVAIMGPSGSGKSTLMNIIGFLDEASSGVYTIDGREATRLRDAELAEIRNDKIGFVFQSFNLLSDLTALSNTELPLVYSGKAQRKKLAMEALEKVSLADRAGHRPKELSGGQQQRVAIARALVNKPSIILADEPTGALDSKTGIEIMELLTELNKAGMTVILVTHDRNVADYADRQIEIMDGKISRDERKADIAEKEKADKGPGRKRGFLSRYLISPLEVLESFLMAIYSIISNKMRTFLTMLGVIIGVASVIAMISIGAGAQKQVTDNISNMGANLLMIYPSRASRNAVGQGTKNNLTYEDAIALREQSQYIDSIDASVSGNSQVVYSNKNWSTTIQGSMTDFPEVMNFEVNMGRFFTETENRMKTMVAVLGKTVKDEIFGEKDPVGEWIKIDRKSFQVVGVLKEKGSSGWRDEDDVIVIPILTAMKRLMGRDRVRNINAALISNDVAAEAEQDITRILRERHKIRDDQEDDFAIRTQAEILDMVSENTKTFTFLLAGIAAISLLVGGIGIMNIMLVSVTERTKEIGIRKAIGARRIDILSQFLIEAVLVSVTGGLIGILGGYGIGQLVSKFAGWQTIVSIQSIMISFGFSLTVGLFFGFYPAKKASALNPIDALRYE